MMTRAAGLARGPDQAEAVLGRLNRLVSRQLPDFAHTSTEPHPPSPRLNAAIAQAQDSVARRLSSAAAAAASSGAPAIGTPALLEELHQRKQALKAAASTPVERATIEIVALLFQSILMEDAIPATVRVWFARLQMPVLRVAVSEPDFFATVEHPARRLIDRMGSCVMGFDSGSRAVGDLLEKEIKRVVQVVEAYPDTGRRVFQTVLTEFEKFLEHYFRNENEASKKGVSLAQQVEQRETMAIQYTIELRKMLNDVPVQEGVREFLFHVWADVLATTAVKSESSEAVKEMKRAAADLIWSASAKVSRSERAEVIRRLPPLLKTLRDGMDEAGIPVPKQDEHIQRLNNSLAAAFTAKAAAISHERLEELMARLETLEELLPEAEQVDIDESLVMDLSGHESSELEVVAEGGSMPTPAMLSWARELQVGSWYMLDYRNRNEAVQLAWQGMRRQLTLFVSPQGRGVLFQQHRLAAFLQAGLLVPAQDEALTVRATRSAMAKIDGDPDALDWSCGFNESGGLPRRRTARRGSGRPALRRGYQNTIRTMIFRSSRSSGPPGIALARSITISRICGGSTPADSRKLMKPIDCSPRCSCSAGDVDRGRCRPAARRPSPRPRRRRRRARSGRPRSLRIRNRPS